jgi:hypothetical protein
MTTTRVSAALVAVIGLATVALVDQAAAGDRAVNRTTESVQPTEFSSYRRYYRARSYGRRYYRPYYYGGYYRPYWRARYYRPYRYYGLYGYPYGYFWPRPFIGVSFGFGPRFWW